MSRAGDDTDPAIPDPVQIEQMILMLEDFEETTRRASFRKLAETLTEAILLAHLHLASLQYGPFWSPDGPGSSTPFGPNVIPFRRV